MNRKLVICLKCEKCKTLRKVVSMLNIENIEDESYKGIEDKILFEKRFCKKGHKLEMAWAIGEWI